MPYDGRREDTRYRGVCQVKQGVAVKNIFQLGGIGACIFYDHQVERDIGGIVKITKYFNGFAAGDVVERAGCYHISMGIYQVNIQIGFWADTTGGKGGLVPLEGADQDTARWNIYRLKIPGGIGWSAEIMGCSCHGPHGSHLARPVSAFLTPEP